MVLKQIQTILCLALPLTLSAFSSQSIPQTSLRQRSSNNNFLNAGAIWSEENWGPLNTKAAVAKTPEQDEDEPINYFPLLQLVRKATTLANSKKVCLDDARSCLNDLKIQQDLLSHTLEHEAAKRVAEVATNLRLKIEVSEATPKTKEGTMQLMVGVF